MRARPAVLFVCLGNICRSPLAEAAFRREAERLGLDVEIDSAGTGSWHVGKAPDARARAVAKANGAPIDDLRARQIAPDDYHRLTHIFALDAENLAAIRAQAPAGGRAEIALLLDCVPGREGEAVADPYYGDAAEFEATWRDVREAAWRMEQNYQRIETTKLGRELAEQRLDAEQKRFEVGMSTTFLVIQAQRDLAIARNNELTALLEYQLAAVAFEAVQQAAFQGLSVR